MWSHFCFLKWKTGTMVFYTPKKIIKIISASVANHAIGCTSQKNIIICEN